MVALVLLVFQVCQVSPFTYPYNIFILLELLSVLKWQSLLHLSLFLQVLRETQVFLAPLAVLVSLVLKERLASLVPLVVQETLALLALQDWLFKDPKDFKAPLDHLDEQVKHLDLSTCVLPGTAAWLSDRVVYRFVLSWNPPTSCCSHWLPEGFEI